MGRCSLASLIRNACRRHAEWPAAWRSAVPRPSYDVVIIGGRSHGLATAYFRARNHGISKVVVLEKGWLGGGNTARNTTIVRSDSLLQQNADFMECSLKRWEGLSQELNFNLMFSPRGFVDLAHSEDQLEHFTQRATVGAVERVRIDPETLEPRIKVIGCDAWSDEAGFDEAIAGTGVTGICGSGIIEAIVEMFLAGIVTGDGLINESVAARTPRLVSENGRTFAYRLRDGPPALLITQNDVRAIQLAKAALYAGARLLLDRMDADTVDRIVLAGAFGNHIEPKYAMVLGLIPDCDLSRVQAAGNAAGTGARIALLNREARREVETLARRVEKVETATENAFQAHFVAALAIPHKTHPFPNLARAVKLPDPGPKSPERRRARKRA